MASSLVAILNGAGFTAPECHYTLKDWVVYKDSLPEAPKKRIDDLFHATLTHKNQFGNNCFNYTFERWTNFFLSKGIVELFIYGSSTRQALDKNKEFSQEYIEQTLEAREDKAADIDVLCQMPGAKKKDRAKVLDDVLQLALQEMYPNGNSPENEIHRLRQTLFANLSNKTGKGRYAHLQFLIFSLNSSIKLNGKDIPLKIDFVISGNHYPLLFNIDQFRISVTKFLKGERYSPVLNNPLEDILQLSRRRLIPNPEINYDELSFTKRLNRSLQGFYLPFSEDEKFVQVVMDPSLHRQSKRITPIERQAIELERRHISAEGAAQQVKNFEKLKRRLSFDEIQAKALSKYHNCSISLTVFAFQMRMMFQKDLIKLQKLIPLNKPACWQEKLINWMQLQLYNPAFFDKISSLTYLLIIKMIEGDSNIRIYEEALRIRLQVQKVTVFLFLPLKKIESSSRYLEEIKEVLDIKDHINDMALFLKSQMMIREKPDFERLLSLIQSEMPSLLKTEHGAIWLLKAHLKGWVSKEMALEFAHESDEYFNALEQDVLEYGKDYLQKFPSTARTLAYYANRKFDTAVIKRSLSSPNDLDDVLVKLKCSLDETLKLLKAHKDLFHRFNDEYLTEIIEQLVFQRGHYELTELINHYLGHFRNNTREKLAIVLEPQAYLADVERVVDFTQSFPFPLPANVIRHAIALSIANAASIMQLHELYAALGGKRGESTQYMCVFSEKCTHTMYKPLEANSKFYVQFYYEVCFQLLNKMNPVDYYDYIINQFMLILPDLTEDEILAVVDRWLKVRHVDKNHLIDHFTTSISRLIIYMDKSIPVKSKKIGKLREKLSLISGICEPHRRVTLDTFYEVSSLFDLKDPAMLEQFLFILANSPLSIRQALPTEYCSNLFADTMAVLNKTNSISLIEIFIFALLGSDKVPNNVPLFHASKEQLRKRVLELFSYIHDYCDNNPVSNNSVSVMNCCIRFMQLLKDKSILEINNNVDFKNRAESFIYTARKYVLARPDFKGMLGYVYKGTVLDNTFLNETASFTEQYCSLI